MTDTATKPPGRNEPCWCGSGRKYKKCHAGQDTTARRGAAHATAGGGAPGRAASPPTVAAVTERVRPGKQSPPREVPAAIPRPAYISTGGVPAGRGPAVPRTPEQVERLRRAGRAARTVLTSLAEHVAPGVTTDELDAVAHEHAVSLGAYPSPLGYQGYPKSICTSVNEVICHGIPDDRPLRDGDILNVDVTLYLDGMHGDTSMMFLVGDVHPERRRLVEATERALLAGIGAVRGGALVRDIGHAIEEVARAERLGIVRAFVGHGVGPEFHCEPTIFHFEDPSARTVLEPGMTFTIEPMLNLGTWRHVMWDDGWTAVTADLSPSAQYEHTVLVTADGAEILTALPDDPQPFLRC